MSIKMLKFTIPMLTMLVAQTGHGVSEWFGRACTLALEGKVYESQSVMLANNPSSMTWKPGAREAYEAETHRRREEARRRVQELTGLGGNPSILNNWANGNPSQDEIIQYNSIIARADEEIARLRKEFELRRQQEEARVRQEAEQRRQEEEARARQEEELLQQREEIRAQQEAEVQLRMQELKDLGGDTSILSRFEKGSGNPEEIREYKAALNRADAEIVRLRNEGNLNNQSAIDQLTEELESQKEENFELRGMIEQLMKRIENLEMGKK